MACVVKMKALDLFAGCFEDKVMRRVSDAPGEENIIYMISQNGSSLNERSAGVNSRSETLGLISAWVRRDVLVKPCLA